MTKEEKEFLEEQTFKEEERQKAIKKRNAKTHRTLKKKLGKIAYSAFMSEIGKKGGSKSRRGKAKKGEYVRK